MRVAVALLGVDRAVPFSTHREMTTPTNGSSIDSASARIHHRAVPIKSPTVIPAPSAILTSHEHSHFSPLGPPADVEEDAPLTNHTAAPQRVSIIAAWTQPGKWKLFLTHGWPTSASPSAIVRQVVVEGTPIALSLLVFFVFLSISLAYVGQRLGSDLQAAFAIASSIFCVVGMSLCIGFLTCVDTLGSQSYGRDPTGRELPVILHRAIWITFGITIPVLFVFFFAAEPVMVSVFGAKLGRPAAEFLRNMPLYLFMNSIGYGLQRALTVQKAAHLSTVSMAVQTATCPIAHHFLTVDSIAGPAWAMGLSVACGTLTAVLLAAFHPASKLNKWPRPYFSSVFDPKETREMFALGMHAMAAVCSEWWAFELLLLGCARYGAVLADSMSVAFSILCLAIACPSAVGTVCSINIGNCLGANQPLEARAWLNVARSLIFTFVVADTVVLLLFCEPLARLFSTDSNVVTVLSGGLPPIVFMHFWDILQNVQQQVYRGVGEQRAGARLSLLSMWGIGLPAAIFCAFATQHMSATWQFGSSMIGFSTGLVAAGAMLYRGSNKWDWHGKAAEASRAQEQQQAAPGPDGGKVDITVTAADDDDGMIASASVESIGSQQKVALVMVRRGSTGSAV